MAISDKHLGLTPTQALIKRGFDISLATIGLILCWWLIAIAWLIASFETRSNGFYVQKRIGLKGASFYVIKIKTMDPKRSNSNTITCADDPRITVSGKLFRKMKIDELPQLFNVVLGQMSFVGPRPDVPGYADQLQGSSRRMLELRPGITGPATLAYRDEEEILAKVPNPKQYNDEVIYPHKVRLNIEYMDSYSIKKDIKYILATILGRPGFTE